MEKVYCPDVFLATEPQDLDTYFKEYLAECNIDQYSSGDVFENRMEMIKEYFDLPLGLDDIKQLDALCTIDKLNVPGENKKLPLEEAPRDDCVPETHPIIEDVRSLHTVRCKEEYNSIKDNLYNELRTLELALYSNKEKLNSQKDIQVGSTFVYKIQIYTPFNTLTGNRLTPESVKVQYEIEVLATNTLLDLANSIKCISDLYIIKEVPDTKVDLAVLNNAKEEYPSRCFFIENVFYNDMSHPKAINYSETIKKWAVDQKIGELRSESMEGVTFKSLKLRHGYGYVYIHQGNCEHVVCFSDVRLMQSTDCLVSKKYPRIISMKRHSHFLCFICNQRQACWLIANSDRLPVRKAFFCTKCCESYMFLDGKKIGEFQLFPYFTVKASTANKDDRVEQDDNDWGYVEEYDET